MKLSEKQKEIIRKMRDGKELSDDGYSYHLHRSGFVVEVCEFEDIDHLMNLGIIKGYTLTTLGRTIEI